jgi:hypothetical protein
MEMTRKISVGGINGVRKGFKGITAPTILARVVGIARVTKWEDGDAGTYCKFTGDFSAWNKDGKGYRAPAVFLPEPAQSLLATAVDADESGNGVEFAFDGLFVGSAPADGNACRRPDGGIAGENQRRPRSAGNEAGTATGNAARRRRGEGRRARTGGRSARQ